MADLLNRSRLAFDVAQFLSSGVVVFHSGRLRLRDGWIAQGPGTRGQRWRPRSGTRALRVLVGGPLECGRTMVAICGLPRRRLPWTSGAY